MEVCNFVKCTEPSNIHPGKQTPSYIYSVTLDEALYVDVKIIEETGLAYVMANDDGTMLLRNANGEEDRGADIAIDEKSIVDFVKRTHAKAQLTKRIRRRTIYAAWKKPFKARWGSEQEALYQYWQGHPEFQNVDVWTFLGMTQEEFSEWKEGILKLDDGSYHLMEYDRYTVVFEVRAAVDELLDQGFIDESYDSADVRACPAKYQEMYNGALVKLFSALRTDREFVLSSILDADVPNIVLSDHNGHVEGFFVYGRHPLEKKDICDALYHVEVEATEANGTKLWELFSRDFAKLPLTKGQDLRKVLRSSAKGLLDVQQFHFLKALRSVREWLDTVNPMDKKDESIVFAMAKLLEESMEDK